MKDKLSQPTIKQPSHQVKQNLRCVRHILAQFSCNILYTETSIPEVVVEQQEKPADDLNITSEQLLFALTSVPPTETTTTTTSGTKEDSSNNATEPISTSATPMDVVDTNEQDKSIIVKELLQPIPTTTTTTSTNTSPPIPANPAPPPTGLGITPNKSTPPPPPPSTTTPSIPLPPPSTTNNTTNQQPKTNNSSSSSPSLTNALSNLPDISAALRRLSSHSVPASVIEQLSSSPRIPNILNERRTSSSSPSEILGNALAAVAANAAAASRSSPKQPQPQTNTATAIGNLAAITANISNLLHSGGFHRNSFSQEDTQKLAAAVAVARNGQQQQQQQQPNQQQRRKSSMATVGNNNTFSNMIEMMGRKNSSSGNINHNNKASASVAVVPPVITPAPVKPKLIVKNEQVWKSLEGVEEKRLGYQLYSPQLVLPNLEANLNGIMEIRVPARYLTFENVRVRKRAVWGTDIYTDDSDIVASTFVECVSYMEKKQILIFSL